MSTEAAAKKPEEAAKEEKKDAHAAPDAPKVKKDLVPLFTFTLVTLNVVMLGVMGFFLNKMWVRVQDLTVRAQTPVVVEKTDDEEKDKHHEMGKEMTATVQGTLFPMESFLVNITSDQGPKYLQAQMELELSDASLEDEVTRKKAAIRDAIIVLLSSRSYRELREANGMKVLRLDILKAINNLLSTGKVKEIYFTQFHFN